MGSGVPLGAVGWAFLLFTEQGVKNRYAAAVKCGVFTSNVVKNFVWCGQSVLSLFASCSSCTVRKNTLLRIVESPQTRINTGFLLFACPIRLHNITISTTFVGYPLVRRLPW